MKTKASQPFIITDKNPKMQPFYYTLICGLQNNQLPLVQLALKHNVDVSKIHLPEDPISAEDDRDFNENIEVLNAIDFARESCIPAIFQAVMESVKLSPEQKNSIILKSLSEVKEGADISTDKSLQEVLQKYVNSKNINQYHKVKFLENPTSLSDRGWGSYENCQATFFHVAVYTGNVSLINKLIELGSDVNLKIKEAEGETAAHILVSNAPHKGDQTNYVNCLVSLLNAGMNLELKNNDKQNGWEVVVGKFKIPELRKIFANHQPTNLATIEMIKSKSRPLMEFWEKQTKGQGFTRYPLIDDVFKYEKRRIELTRDVTSVEKVEQFLKHKSLKKALEQRYGFSSSRLSTVITKNLFDRSQEGKVVVQPVILQIADWVKVLFTDNNALNTSDFLEVLESYNSKEKCGLDAVNNDLNHGYRADKKRVGEFKNLMNKIYTAQQKKAVLMSPADLEDSVDDTCDMYSKFSKELDIILKRIKFSDIDSLQKLHDVISGEVETLEQADFPLEQDTVNPKLKALNKIKMNLGYGVKLAESNHELIRWGAQMGHCVGGGDYAEDAKKGETIILAITQENEAKYCIEISPRGEIRQVQGKSHSRPESTIMEEFVKELKSKGILNRNQKASAWKPRD